MCGGKDFKILIGVTELRAKIFVCVNCCFFGEPHFIYETDKRTQFHSSSVTVSLLRAELIDSFENLELKERVDIDKFLNSKVTLEKVKKSNRLVKKLNKEFFKDYRKSIKKYGQEYFQEIKDNPYQKFELNNFTDMTYWEVIINVWNTYNKEDIQVPKNVYKPNYINLKEYEDNCYITNKYDSRDFLDGACLITRRDQEYKPNFHYVLKDGTDISILFEKPEYLEPIPRKLKQDELDRLVKFLKMKRKGKNENTNWENGVWLWNDQNYNENENNFGVLPQYKKINEDIKMPDYTKLNDKEYLIL